MTTGTQTTQTGDAEDRLATAAAARIVGVHAQTLRNYERRGFITSTRTPGGNRRFRRGDLEALRDNPPFEDLDALVDIPPLD